MNLRTWRNGDAEGWLQVILQLTFALFKGVVHNYNLKLSYTHFLPTPLPHSSHCHILQSSSPSYFLWINNSLALLGRQLYFVVVIQSCLALCDPMDFSTPGFPVLHYLPEFAQTHVHWVSDAIQPSHPLSLTSPAFIASQHQSHFQWVGTSHQVAKVLELQLQLYLRYGFLLTLDLVLSILREGSHWLNAVSAAVASTVPHTQRTSRRCYWSELFSILEGRQD